MKIKFPLYFTPQRLSPTMFELQDLCKWLINQKIDKVLEFGGGPTSYLLYTVLQPQKYVVMEDFDPVVKIIKEHLPQITLITTTWKDIPKDKYDLIFVDSSSGYLPKKENKGLHRKEAVEFSEQLQCKNAYIIIHDWDKRSGRSARKYLDGSNKYKMEEAIKGRHGGFGIYKRC